MPRYCITLIEYQTLLDTTDVFVEAKSPEAAARIALASVAADTDTNGERAVSLPDGQCGVLEPEEVGDCDIIAEVRDHPAGGVLGCFGASRRLRLSRTDCRHVLAMLSRIPAGRMTETQAAACHQLAAQLQELVGA